MIISYESHHKILVENGKVTVIKLASPIVYRDFVLSFQGKSDKVKVFNDEYDEKDICKECDFVGDVLLNENVLDKYMLKIINSVFESINEDNRNETFKIWQNLTTNLQQSLFMSDLPLEIDNNVDLKKLYKFSGIHFDQQLSLNPYDIIETVVKIHEECKLKSVVVLTNVLHYLNTQQLNDLIEFIKEINLPLVLIEFSSSKFQVNNEDASVCCIDEDFVDWY